MDFSMIVVVVVVCHVVRSQQWEARRPHGRNNKMTQTAKLFLLLCVSVSL